jgi:hypothetical protein
LKLKWVISKNYLNIHLYIVLNFVPESIYSEKTKSNLQINLNMYLINNYPEIKIGMSNFSKHGTLAV